MTKTAKTSPIPENYHSLTPYLIVKGAAQALEFYKTALGATETLRMPGPGGVVAHAEMRIGDSQLMLADEFPDMGAKGPKTLGGTPVSLLLYVPDVDATADRAIKAGMVVRRPVTNQFYGDRSGTFEDPYGHVWTLATHVEDVPGEELRRRAESHFLKG